MKSKMYFYVIKYVGPKSQILRLRVKPINDALYFNALPEAKKELREYMTRNLLVWQHALKRVVAIDIRDFTITKKDLQSIIDGESIP